MSLVREFIGRFETSYRPEWGRSVSEDLIENRTKLRGKLLHLPVNHGKHNLLQSAMPK
jgi:hypothetical protein